MHMPTNTPHLSSTNTNINLLNNTTMQTNINLNLLNSNYIFYLSTTDDFSFRDSILLGDKADSKNQVEGYLRIIPKDKPLHDLWNELRFYLFIVASNGGPSDDDYYDYIPDACDQLLQIAARKSWDHFEMYFMDLHQDPNLNSFYQDDEDGTLSFYNKDAKEQYEYYLTYGLE